jgi:phosphoglycolate phosphatase
MNKSFEAVGFDLDGTLWDASITSAEAGTKALAELGYENVTISPSDVRSVSGLPFVECAKSLLPQVPTNDFDRIVLGLDAAERELISNKGGRVFDDVFEELEELSHHRKLFLISNCQQWYLHSFLELNDCAKFFVGWACYGFPHESKSENLVYLKSKHALQNPLYIGDTRGDEEAARKASFAFGHVDMVSEWLPHPIFVLLAFEKSALFWFFVEDKRGF